VTRAAEAAGLGMVPRRCHACGTGRVVPVAKEGRTERYHGEVLEIPANLPIPTCDRCGAEWMDPDTARRIDEALGKVASRRLVETRE